MLRAYAFLNAKSVDGEKRIITGTATTPTPDRMGDVVEPLGVQFKNPLPLLLYHNSQKPVGWVKFQKPTKDGIDFEAHLPTINESGTVRDRIEEAWTSIKTGLLAGVSIGFKSIEEDFNKETNGFRFLKTEVLELSLVAIPAQPDARIDTIKSLDIGRPSASGSGPSRHSAGVSAFPNGKSMHLQERITSLTTERAKIAETMKGLMAPVLDGSGDLDANQKTAYDGASASLRDIDEQISRFTALEQAEAGVAKGVDATDLSSGSRARSPYSHVEVKEQKLPPGIEFTRFTICKIAGRLLGVSPLEVAKERYPSNPRIQMMLKTAVAGMTTTDATYAGPLTEVAQTLVGEFLEFLRPRTLVGQFGTGNIPSLNRVPFNSRIQSQTTGGSANWVGQGKGKPVTKFGYDAINLYWAKIAAICVLADELIRFSSPSAEARVRDAIAKAIIARMDIDFVDPSKAAVSNVSPASITNGISAIAHSGTDADAVRAGLSALIGHFVAAGNDDPTSLVLMMPTSIALQLSLMRNSLGNKEFDGVTMRGGTLEGLPVLTSGYMNVGDSPHDNIVVLVKADEIFLADDGGVTVDASDQASIEMSDNPESDTGTVVSMFQTNNLAIRAERYVNWARGRSSSVAWLDAVAWSA